MQHFEHRPARKLALRALLIIVAALLLAALACSIDVTTVHFDNPRLFKDPQGEDGTRSYARDETFYCLVNMKDVEDEIEVRAEWQTAGVVEEDVDPVFETLHTETLTVTENTRLSFTLAPPGDGWGRGDYRLRLYLNGDHKETIEFVVK